MFFMMRIFKFGQIILPVLITMMVTGCLKDDWEEKARHEKEILETYLQNHNITEQQKTAGGIYFIEQVAGTGLTPRNGNFVVINFTGRYLEDGSIHETSYDSLKPEWENADLYSFFVFGPLKFQFGNSITGINEGLSLMKEGGKAQLVIPSDRAFYDYKPLVYEIHLLKVIRNPVQYEDSVLNAYLETKGIESDRLLVSGSDSIYFVETVVNNPLDSLTVEQNDTVLFRYSARLIDGFGPVIHDDRVFDSNMEEEKPIEYVFGANRLIFGSMIAFPDGLRIAIDNMRAGTHATAILPYKAAFDDKGLYSTTYGYTIVPKYQTVVYDIIVESIKSPD